MAGPPQESRPHATALSWAALVWLADRYALSRRSRDRFARLRRPELLALLCCPGPGRLLCFLRENAPEADRESMIHNVPLHGDIMLAAQSLP